MTRLYRLLWICTTAAGCAADVGLLDSRELPPPAAPPPPPALPPPPPALPPLAELDSSKMKGLWLVDQPTHALYEASLFAFAGDGVVSNIRNFGGPPPAAISRGGVTCTFGSRWDSLERDSVLAVEGTCDDGVARELRFAFDAPIEEWELDARVRVVSAGGEVGWAHEGPEWVFRKCSDPSCLTVFERVACSSECCANVDCSEGSFCCSADNPTCDTPGRCRPISCFTPTHVDRADRRDGAVELRFTQTGITCLDIPSPDHFRVYVSTDDGATFLPRVELENGAPPLSSALQTVRVSGLENGRVYAFEVRPIVGALEGTSDNMLFAMPAPAETIVAEVGVEGMIASAPSYDRDRDRLLFGADLEVWIAQGALTGRGPEYRRVALDAIEPVWRGDDILYIGREPPHVYRMTWPGGQDDVLFSATTAIHGLRAAPDGRSYAIGHGDEIRVHPLDGAEPGTRIVRAPGSGSRASHPAFDAAGAHLLFSAGFGADRGVYRASLSVEAEPELLFDGPKSELGAVLSRDGRHVFYASDQSGAFEVWALALETGRRVQLTGGERVHDASDPEWTEDGVFVAAIDGAEPRRRIALLAPPTLP